MTREEYLDKNSWFLDFDMIGIVNDIYDDFGSRTCENCRHLSGGWSGDCTNSEVKGMMRTSYMGYPTLSPERDFGCNKWDAK